MTETISSSISHVDNDHSLNVTRKKTCALLTKLFDAMRVGQTQEMPQDRLVSRTRSYKSDAATRVRYGTSQVFFVNLFNTVRICIVVRLGRYSVMIPMRFNDEYSLNVRRETFLHLQKYF